MKSFVLIKQILRTRPYFRYFLLLWFLTVTLFIWLININLLAFVLTAPVFTAVERADFILSAYANFFRYLNNPVALSSVIFSILVAVNFTLIVFLWREGKQRVKTAGGNVGAFVSMVGAHCVSCGTSLVAPLVTALAGSGAYFSAERFAATQMLATGANLLGITLILWSTKRTIKRIRTSGLVRAGQPIGYND